MPWFDRPLDHPASYQLREYRTDTAEPPELDLWWQLRLAQARAAPLRAPGPGPRRGAPARVAACAPSTHCCRRSITSCSLCTRVVWAAGGRPAPPATTLARMPNGPESARLMTRGIARLEGHY